MSAILFVDTLSPLSLLLSLSHSLCLSYCIHFEEKGVLRIILVMTKLQNDFKNSH